MENCNENWYARAYNKLHFDMHTPGHVAGVGKNFDPEAFAQSVSMSGAEAVVFFARCAYGWAYFPSEIMSPHPHLMGDVFGSGAQALKDAGVGVVAYAATDSLSLADAKRHEDWCYRGPDGEIHARETNGSELGYPVCPTSSFFGDHFIPFLVEAVARYPINAIWLDGFYSFFIYRCHCRRCLDAFGKPIPHEKTDPHWRQYTQFILNLLYAAMNSAAEVVRDVRHGCVMGSDWIGGLRWSVPPPENFGFLSADVRLDHGTSSTAFGLSPWTWRSIPADVYTQRMRWWQDFSCRSPENIKSEFAVSLSSGARLMIGDLLQPTRMNQDPEVTKLIRTCFDAVSYIVPLVENTQPIADIAILSSPEKIREQAGDWKVDDGPVEAAYLSITQCGYTAHVLYDDDLSLHLHNYRVLVIPELSFVGSQAGETIQEYVKNGGNLLLCGCLPKTVSPDEPDESARPDLFQEICGLENRGYHQFTTSYIDLKALSSFSSDDSDIRPLLGAKGPVVYAITAGATTELPLILPGEEYQIGAVPPGEVSAYPALTTHQYESGMVMTCMLPIFTEISRIGNPWAVKFTGELIAHVGKETRLKRTGFSPAQVFFAEGEKLTIVHLVAYHPSMINSPHVVLESTPITGVSFALRDDRTATSVVLMPGGESLEPVYTDGIYHVDVPGFTIHSAVVFRWE